MLLPYGYIVLQQIVLFKKLLGFLKINSFQRSNFKISCSLPVSIYIPFQKQVNWLSSVIKKAYIGETGLFANSTYNDS